MSREEAIEILKTLKPNMRFDDTGWLYTEQALEMAISALEQEPTDDATLKDIFCMGCEYKDAEPCEDAISREAVIKLFNGNIGSEAALILHKVKQLPSVTPKPKTGHWTGVTMTYRYRCSECGNTADYRDNYCPSCGCRMVEPQERSDKECQSMTSLSNTQKSII